MFVATIEAAAVSAAQDLFAITAPTTRSVVVHRIEVGQDTSETSETLPIRLRRGVGATAGSGGSAVTPVRLRPGAQTASATVARNNTTAATAGSGTLSTLARRAFNLVTGFVYDPAPEQRIVIAPGETFLANLPSAPDGALTVSAEIVFEEVA